MALRRTPRREPNAGGSRREPEAQPPTITLVFKEGSSEYERKFLTKHSDYFKAMFEGDFKESRQESVNVMSFDKGIIDTLMELAMNEDHPVKDDILKVFTAANTLLFKKVADNCLVRILKSLSVDNCLNVWFFIEQLNIKPLYLKAKMFSLLRFSEVKNHQQFFEANIDEVCSYLANVHLMCENEMEVFGAAVQWYEKNTGHQEGIMLRLLHCINFTDISYHCLKTRICPTVSLLKCPEAKSVLDYIADYKWVQNFEQVSTQIEENLAAEGRAMVRNKLRNKQGYPCFVVNKFVKGKSGEVAILLYEPRTLSFRTSIVVDIPNIHNLEGFEVFGYKNFICLVGGEYGLGKGGWNTTLYAYDILQEKWTTRAKAPKARRHFESCLVGDKFFIVGGTGPLRIIEKNMFYYDFAEERWSEETLDLPWDGRQMKCCSFENRLLLLNMNVRLFYHLSKDMKKWEPIELVDNNRLLPPYSKRLMMFSYNDHLMMKLDALYTLTRGLNECTLGVMRRTAVSDVSYYEVKTVVCGNYLYSLSKDKRIDCDKDILSFEVFDMETGRVHHLFTKSLEKDIAEIVSAHGKDPELFKFRIPLNIFSVFHYYFLAHDELINDE